MDEFSLKTDQELVSLSLKNAEYFYHIMQRYEQKLLRYVRRFTGLSQEFAEDIVQETFLKSYKNLNDYDADLPFSSWIYRITHNEAISQLRKKQHQYVSLETSAEDTKQLIEILQSDHDVVRDVVREEIISKVRSVLQSLPSKDREILILYYLEEKSYEEISNILKKPMGTVAALLSRAKDHFKQLAVRQNLTADLIAT